MQYSPGGDWYPEDSQAGWPPFVAAERRLAAQHLAAAQVAAGTATGKFDFDAGLQALEAKKYRRAIEIFQTVANRPFPAGPYAQPARQKLNEIEALASEQLGAADTLIQEGKFQEAIDLLFEVKRTFAGSHAAATARARLDELSRSPALLAATRKAAAEDLLADAKLYIESGDLLRGVGCYKQLAQQHADAPQGKEAQETLAAFDADDEFQKQLQACQADAKCRTLLSLARSYRANKLFDAARSNYKQVLEQFPDSQFAQSASEELKALEEEMKAAGH